MTPVPVTDSHDCAAVDSIPAVPPAAAQTQPSDLLFPDVKWIDAPPVPPSAEEGGGAGSLSGARSPAQCDIVFR